MYTSDSFTFWLVVFCALYHISTAFEATGLSIGCGGEYTVSILVTFQDTRDDDAIMVLKSPAKSVAIVPTSNGKREFLILISYNFRGDSELGLPVDHNGKNVLLWASGQFSAAASLEYKNFDNAPI